MRALPGAKRSTCQRPRQAPPPGVRHRVTSLGAARSADAQHDGGLRSPGCWQACCGPLPLCYSPAVSSKTYDLRRPTATLTVVWTREAFSRAARRYGLRLASPDTDTSAEAMVYRAVKGNPKKTGVPHWVVMLRPDATAGVVAHEALHVCTAAFDYSGWPISFKADEVLGSVLEAVVDLIELTRPRPKT